MLARRRDQLAPLILPDFSQRLAGLVTIALAADEQKAGRGAAGFAVSTPLSGAKQGSMVNRSLIIYCVVG